MDIKVIKQLMGLLEGSKLSELEVSEESEGKSLRVSLKKHGERVTVEAAVPVADAAATDVGPQGATMPKSAQQLPLSEGVVDFNLVEDVKSPMVGVFYAAASPDAPPFVRKGSKVQKGDTLCIIEAMKLMNEVVAERDGEIVEVLAGNGELVEFGQVLFKIF